MLVKECYQGACVVLFLSFAVAANPPEPGPSATDEAAITALLQGLQEGWNLKSGAAWSAAFAQQHNAREADGSLEGCRIPERSGDSGARCARGGVDGSVNDACLEQASFYTASTNPASFAIRSAW